MQKKNRTFVNPDTPWMGNIIEKVTRNGMPDNADVIYSGRNTLFCLTGDDTGNAGPRINVKAFRNPRFPNNFIYSRLRDSKARRSYLHARQLLQMGFLTPQPYGYGEVSAGGKFRESYYFCRHLPYPDLRCWEIRDDYRELTDALGREIARLHKAGIWMKDFSTGNMLMELTPEGEYRFYHIDLNRMEFNVRDEKKLMRMFRSLSTEPNHVKVIARAYAAAAGKDPGKTVRMAEDAFNQFLESKRCKNRLKSILSRLTGKTIKKQADNRI